MLQKLFLQLLVMSVALIGCGSLVLGQQRYPPFTTVATRTDYDAKGEVLSIREWTTFHSANGDFRSVGNSSGGYEMATLYLRGHGVFTANSRTAVLIKNSDHAPGCPIRTAEQLCADPHFNRTETVLGFKAYVIRERLPVGYVMETFFVPELGGGTPIKRVSAFDDGRKIVDEPISITLGEPATADISGPNYRLINQPPVFNKELDKAIISKPNPVYPSAARSRRLSGTISVSVVVDENGRVLTATASPPIPFLTEAALEVSYEAWFNPTIVDGMPVVAQGIISYQFVLPRR